MDLQWLVCCPRGTPTRGAHLQRAVNVGVRLQGVEIERLMNGIRRRFSFDFRVQNIFAEKDGYLVCKIWKISRVLGWKWHNRIKISRTWWKKIFEKIKTCDISHGGINRIKNSKKDARKKKNFLLQKKKFPHCFLPYKLHVSSVLPYWNSKRIFKKRRKLIYKRFCFKNWKKQK